MHPLTLLLEVSGMAKSTFYYQISKEKEPVKYSSLREKIVEIYRKHKRRYGYRRITMCLHQQGLRVNHKVVLRVMRELGMNSRRTAKKYNSYKIETGKPAPNLLKRNFNSQLPASRLVTDVSEFNILGEKLYLSPVLDLYN